MMAIQEQSREQIREALNRSVSDSAAYFARVSPVLGDGRHTAHGVLAQLVFWHERHVEVARALVEGCEPNLIHGTVEMLNAGARHRYARDSMVDLAQRLSVLQQELDGLLARLPDWSVNFPLKRDSGFCNVEERVRLLEENVRNRLILMRRAGRG